MTVSDRIENLLNTMAGVDFAVELACHYILEQFPTSYSLNIKIINLMFVVILTPRPLTNRIWDNENSLLEYCREDALDKESRCYFETTNKFIIMGKYQYWDVLIVDIFWLLVRVFDDLNRDGNNFILIKKLRPRMGCEPLWESFFVLIILAANSSWELFWIHRRTIEKAPLDHPKYIYKD